MIFKTRSSRKKSGIFNRLFKTFFSVIVLTSFVVLISLFVRKVSMLNATEVGKLSAGLLHKAKINIDENKAGEVAGQVAQRLSDTNLTATNTEDGAEKKTLLLTAAIISEVQEDYYNFEETLKKIKEKDIKQIFVLGDLTNYGEVDKIQRAKDLLDSSELSYYVIPGDHDLAQSVGPGNFLQVFKQDYFNINVNGVNFLLLNNSANFTKINSETVTRFKIDLSGCDFVLLSQPLYAEGLNLPFSKMYMGSTKEEQEDANKKDMQTSVYNQRNEILEALQNSKVKAVFAGDHHKSSQATDPKRADLKHFVVGAISSTVNEFPQKIIQSPRFSVLDVYSNGSYNVSEVLLD